MFEKNRRSIENEIKSLLLPTQQQWYEGSEWIETNGIGGWAGASVSGCNTRRYHGLLVAATSPPSGRMVLLSRLDETIVAGNETFELATCIYEGNVVHPEGYRYLTSFSKGLFPQWHYQVNDIVLKKEILMVHGENTTVIVYEVVEAGTSFTLQFLPLIAARGYHDLQHSANNIFWDVGFENGLFHNHPYENAPEVFIQVPDSTYHHHPCWYYNFHYPVEQYRGLDYTEDLFNHGTIEVRLAKGDRLGIIVSTNNPFNRDAFALFEQEKKRKTDLLNKAPLPTGTPFDHRYHPLLLAADQFIVQKDTGLKTVIAGYHWFADWGRDTMISLPGLCLSTGRYEDARNILGAYAAYVNRGMLPNRFPEDNQPAEYNNVDGTLWYFIAIYEYLQATGDREFVLGTMLPVLKEIIDWHYKGTRFGIHVNEEGFLYAAEKGWQLTWMDAKIGNRVVTPRMGQPVEIQALWYNALRIFSSLLQLNGDKNDAERILAGAEKLRVHFPEKFWYAAGNHLYDVIDENGNPDASLRPNQLFAVSLPFPLVEGTKAQKMLAIIQEKLYTPRGLRTLSPDDARYVPVYGGDTAKRDAAYHQGTVWPWLLGPYIDALLRINSDKTEAKKVIDAFLVHLHEAGIGTVSEIFDGDAPHCPRGCIAQAWSVAEILRVIQKLT